jgi:hypothetical protein
MRSPQTAVIVALAMLAAVGYGDYLTGFEVSFYLFYSVPIAWVAWSAGVGWGLALSALASAVWAWADVAAGHRYSQAWIIWERAAMNLATFAFIAYCFAQFRRNLASKDRKVTQLEGILPICIACKRISTPGGNWVDMGEYLDERSGAKTERCLCPECRGERTA